MSPPRSIVGSPGSRIKVILGETGSDYIIYCDHDDGDREWQTVNWPTRSGGPPNGLCKQINNIANKGRHITDLSYDTSGQWYVRGCKRDGTGEHSWWGGVSDYVSNEIKNTNDLKVVFGHSAGIILSGKNGYSQFGEIDGGLYSRMKKINSKRKTIKFIRLFTIHGYNPGYFISDDEGTEWCNAGVHLSKELKTKNQREPIVDVAVARDGSWIVFQNSRFTASEGISSDLTVKMSAFYRNQSNRQTERGRQIKVYNVRIAEQDERKRQEAEEQVRKEQEETNMRERDKERKLKEFTLKRQCDDNDRLFQIESKRLKAMERVTAIGFSSEPGDALVKRIEPNGAIEVYKPRSRQEGTIIVRDPRLLTKFYSTEEPESLLLMCLAYDKYEAAISVYHCVCHNGSCKCTRLFSGNFLRQAILSGAPNGHGRLVTPLPRPITENALGSETMGFDEYKCAEKIDVHRLKEIVANLATDSKFRKECLDRLQRQQINNEVTDGMKKLQRCSALEEVAKTLAARLTNHPISEDGCVVYQVDYEHRDPSGRGRLFAIGDQIHMSDDKYPRTATLQGMPSDLRAALVGKFAHDIDCENSEVRLICSLANQLNLKHLVPTIFSYRDDRAKWLRTIASTHGVSEGEAKRLPNIILCGGRYETWLKRVGKSKKAISSDIKRFYISLYSEIAAFRDQLLQHPRFKWTQVEKEKLLKEGRPSGTIDTALMPRIVQCCENEVLGIIHRTFHQNYWLVRAKVFDGLVVEAGNGATLSLDEVNKLAESMCKHLGWDIRLSEKPLYGKQEDPIQTIQDTRDIYGINVD